MVISKETLYLIKKIIDKHYNSLTISVLGTSVFAAEELAQFKAQGIDLSNKNSFLEMVYHHSFLNETRDASSPVSINEMSAQQSNKSILPVGEAHSYTIGQLNDNAKNLLDKMKQDTISRFSGVIHDLGQDYKFDSLQNLDRSEDADKIVKESTIGQLKQTLKSLEPEGNRNWDRIIATEMSNAVGLGATDRIVTENRGKDLEDVYVYRIVVNDGALCKYCKRFYLDNDGTPKVYRLSDLLDNGSNYGKKVDSWLPVVGATHPNDRESQPIQLKPGWAVTVGGNVKFIGLESWKNYILNKVKI